jgi:hypothetical protein
MTTPPAGESRGLGTKPIMPFGGKSTMISHRQKWELFKNIKEPLPLPRG